MYLSCTLSITSILPNPQISHPYNRIGLKAKFQCHPARCLLPVEIMQRCGLATGPATVELLPYLLPY